MTQCSRQGGEGLDVDEVLCSSKG